jgi:hypothetical protein
MRPSLLPVLLCSMPFGCTNALLEPMPFAETSLDDRLQVRGSVCTSPPNSTDFPVKVEFLIDKSGSMCVTDPPGSQQTGNFCEQRNPAGVPVPGRVLALQDLILRRFAGQPNVYVAVDPFESKVSNSFPAITENGPFFHPASHAGLPQQIRDLQANLGKGTDYEGALSAAYRRIEADIQHTLRSSPAQLPRTKYVVILLTDGTPYPRCSMNDDLPADQYATPEHPELIWRDGPADPPSPSGAKGFCNAGNGDIVEVPGFYGATDRNQNYQLWDGVDRLMSLKDKYNIGDIRLHTILLFSLEAVRACGAICLDPVTGLFPGMPSPEAAESVARWTLQQMAEVHGNGTFQEFTDAASIQLGAVDYSSLASRYVVKTLMASNEYASPSETGPVPDSDGDGIPDERDSPRSLGTSRFDTDTDRDGFTDAFEDSHRAEGFDPLVPDPRGCLSVAGKFTAQYDCSDTDHDGAMLPQEVYLGTNPTLPDSDADGVLDGAESKRGLDPQKTNSSIGDLDSDGVTDILESLYHTDPLVDDRTVHAATQYHYHVAPRVDGNRNCYDFVISNLKLVKTDRASGLIGFNYITVTFGEAPESGVQRDYGAWRQACVLAQFVPPSLRIPQGPEVVLEDSDFRPIGQLQQQRGSLMPPDAAVDRVCKGARLLQR